MLSISQIQRAAWHFLHHKSNPQNGLVLDQWGGDAVYVPSSVAVTGMALTALPVATQNGWISRREAAQRAVRTLRFFAREAEECGGFFFHFLDMKTGKRAWECEISSVDSAFLFLGALFCAAFFARQTGVESEIRDLAHQIFARADWKWFCNGKDAISLAFTPEKGFSRHTWQGWNEALPLAILALGSPSYTLPTESYEAWTQTYRFKRLYGHDFLFCGPLFTHLFPHLWLDLRGLRDAPMRKCGFDYFENTSRAVAIQVEWARRRGDARAWGVSACDAPQGGTLGGYRARGVPFGRFDDVWTPPICLASLPFAPELALEGWNFWLRKYPELVGEWGVRGGVHPPSGWMSGWFGLDQGMLVLMLENARTGVLWELSRTVPALQIGLQRAGFEKSD